MKTKFIFFSLSVFLILLSCNYQNNSPQDEKKIENLIHNYSAVFDNKNFDGFTEFCSENFKFFTLDGRIFDKNSLGNFLKRIMARWNNLKSKIYELDIQVDHRLAFARYRQKLTYVTGRKNGVMNNLITVIFIKLNSTWKMAHYHMTTKY